MKKRWISVVVLLCLFCGVMCACQPKEEIDAEQAVAVVMEDLGDLAQYAGSPHVHTGTYDNEGCYNVYVTVNNDSWVYVISLCGEIIFKGPSSHSH